MNIHRVIQEAIHNSLKHSDPSQITVTVEQQLHNLKIVISDDGNGFDPKTVQRGNGLNNMQKRIDDIHGKLQIILNKGEGTQVQIII